MIDRAAFGLRGDLHGAQFARAGSIAQGDFPLADPPALGRGVDDQLVTAACAADAVGFPRTRGQAGQFGERALRRVETVKHDPGAGEIAAIAGEDDHARLAHIDEVDIVERGMLAEALHLAVEAIDIQPRLLVGRDDQAVGGRCRIAPDRRIVGGVLVGGDHRHGLRHCEDRHGGIAGGRDRRAGGGDPEAGKCENLEFTAHQNVTLKPPFMVQLYSSYW